MDASLRSGFQKKTGCSSKTDPCRPPTCSPGTGPLGGLPCPLHPADVAEHVGMDVQADIGHVVNMFAGHEPDDLADPAFRIIAGQASKGVRADLLVRCQLGHVIQCCALGIAKERTGSVLL